MEKDVLNKIKMLRGVLAAGLTTVALETGDGKVMQGPEFDKKIEPVTQNLSSEQNSQNILSEELPTDTIAMPLPVAERASSIPVAEMDTSLPPLNMPKQAQEDVEVDYNEIKNIDEDMHYDMCVDFMGECEDEGYGKQELDYDVKLDLALSAIELEMSQVMHENMLPAMEGVLDMSDKMSEIVDKFASAQDQGIEKKDLKDIKKISREHGKDMLKSYKKMAELAKETKYISSLSEQYEKDGTKANEKYLDNKISKTYKYAKDFSEEREAKEARSSEKNNQANISMILKNTKGAYYGD